MKALELARKKARIAIESLYEGVCTVINFEEAIVDGVTKLKEVTVIENEPCRLSQKAIQSNQSDTANTITYTPILFMSPDVPIKPGSKITVIQNSITQNFEQSGEPVVCATHQVLALKSIKRA